MKLKMRRVVETRNSFSEVGMLLGRPERTKIDGHKKPVTLRQIEASAKFAMADAKRPVVIRFKGTGATMKGK